MNLPTPLKAGYRPNSGYDLAETNCLYCKQLLGHHAEDCICVTRTVVVEMTVQYVVEVPRKNTVEEIEFYRGGSSFCLGNDIHQLEQEAIRNKGICTICHRAKVRYLREASKEDHESMAFMPSEH